MNQVWRTLGYAATRSARHTALPLAGACVATHICLSWLPRIPGAGADTDASANLWLQLPCWVATLAVVMTTVDAWPLFSIARPGAATLRRMRPRGGEGCLPAGAGAMLTLAVALTASAVVFVALSSARGELPTVHAYTRFERTAGPPMIDRRGAAATFTAAQRASSGRISALRLTPLAMWSGGTYASANLRVTSNGKPLHDGAVRVAGSHEQVEIRFPPRHLTQFEIRLTPESGIVLMFPVGSVVGASARSYSPFYNVLFAAWTYLLPAALTLSLLATARHYLTLPTARAVAFLLLIAAPWVDGLAVGPAMVAMARRHWIPGENLFEGSAVALCMVALLTASALWVRNRNSR